MRDRSSRSHDSQGLPTPSPCTEDHSSLNLELSALKMKNMELSRVNTKLKMDTASLRNEIYDLQAENMSIYTKYNNIKRVYKTLQDKLKSSMPSCLDFLNLLLQITGQNNEMSLLSPVSSKVSLSGATSPVKTQTVKPHTVNGTVLHRPTISLTRLGIPEAFNQPSTSRASHNTDNIENVNPNRGSTRNSSFTRSSSRSPRYSGHDEESNRNITTEEDNGANHILSRERKRNGHLFSRNEENDSDSEEDERQEEDHRFVSHRTSKKRPSSTQPELSDSSDENEENQNPEEEEEQEACFEEQQGNEQAAGLSTICEENEITIILPRLSDSQLASALSSQFMRQSRPSFNDTTDAQNNDSYLDMTLAEESLRASKRLRVELTVFEPRGNSTTVGTTGCSPNQSLSSPLTPSPNCTRALTGKTDMSRLEVTPECSVTDSELMLFVNTPSASMLGDINPQTSKLSILEGTNSPETPKSYTPRTRRTKNTADENKGNHLTSPPLKRMSISSRRTKNTTDENKGNNLTTPPLKRISFSSKRRVLSNVAEIKSPIIVLERMESFSGISKTEINAEVLGSILNTAVAKKSNEVTKKRGNPKKSKKSSARRRTCKKEEETDESVSQDTLEEKIREVQRRLSSYNPKQSEESEIAVSPSKRRGRPSRAAKPKDLKEPSSKIKLRRM